MQDNTRPIHRETHFVKEEDEIESFLMQAYQNQNALSKLYEALYKSDIYLLGLNNHKRSSDEDSLSLYHYHLESQIDALAFFSTEKKAFKALESVNQNIGASTAKVLKLSAKELFQLSKGQALVLNPNHEWSKLFHPNEILNLLEVFNEGIIKEKITDPVRFFSLDNPPEVLLAEALGQLKSTRNIKQAFLLGFETKSDKIDNAFQEIKELEQKKQKHKAQEHSLNRQEIDESGYLLAIEFISNTNKDETESLMSSIGEYLIDYIEDEVILDLCAILPDCSISQFIKKNIKPFYEFKGGSFLRDIELYSK